MDHEGHRDCPDCPAVGPGVGNGDPVHGDRVRGGPVGLWYHMGLVVHDNRGGPVGEGVHGDKVPEVGGCGLIEVCILCSHVDLIVRGGHDEDSEVGTCS